MSNTFIWPLDKTLSVDTTPGQSGPGSDGSDGVFRIPQSSRLFSVISGYPLEVPMV